MCSSQWSVRYRGGWDHVFEGQVFAWVALYPFLVQLLGTFNDKSAHGSHLL